MSNNSTFAKIFTVIAKVIAALSALGGIIIFVFLIFLIRSCYAPLYDHTVEVYLRNKSEAPLSVSFVAPKKDVLLDTIWWLGGKQREENEVDPYMVRGLFLDTRRLSFGEIFTPYNESLLIKGSTDTVYYSRRQIPKIVYTKRGSAGVDSLAPNPDFLKWKNKMTPPSQLPQALYSYLVPYAHPPLILEQFAADSVRFTFQVLAQDSLLVASKSEAFHASDPSYVSSSDFALNSAIVQWKTLAGKDVHMRLPAKARLETLLKSAPDPKSTKFYYYIHYIDYK